MTAERFDCPDDLHAIAVEQLTIGCVVGHIAADFIRYREELFPPLNQE